MNKSLVTLALTVAVAACSESTGPNGTPQVGLSFSTAVPSANPAAPAPVAFFLSDTIIAGNDELIIERVQLVLREIELKRQFAPDCLEEDSCEEFETGPLLVDLPLNGQTEQQLAIAIDPDTYDEIEFEIHKPSDDSEADRLFIQQNPDFADASIRAEGTFNGDPFTYVSDLNEDQEFDLNPPLVVTDAGVSTNVTIRIDLTAWFSDRAGGLVDPATGNKGGANERLIEENIKDSIRAFEDEDGDGDDTDEDD